MTEEPKTPTPALRLKPRLRPAEEAAPAAAAAAASVPAVEAPSAPVPSPIEGVKFRLKPKADLAPAPVTPDLIAALREPGATIPPTPPAPREIPPPPAPTPFPKPPAPVAAAPALAPAPAPAPGSSGTRPPFTRPPIPKPGAPAPVVRSARNTVAPFPVPHLKVSAEMPEVVAPAPAAAVKRGSGGLIASLVALVVFGAGGYFAWRHFAAKPAPAAPTSPAPVAAAPTPAAGAPAKPAPAPAAAPATGSTPSDTLNKIAQIPGNAINKAQDAIAARRASGQTRVDAAAIGEDQPAKKSAPKAPAAPASNTANAMTAVAPNLAASTVLEAAEASPAFVAWVVASKVNGVFQGNPARAMINGRLTRTGETVDASLGIIFDRVEADKKQLIFKDGSGATVTRKY